MSRSPAGGCRPKWSVENLGGHKLPTAYPSRRAWLHVVVRDANRQVVFESGALRPDGSVEGNDNDADAAKFEPHYTRDPQPDQVQIYEIDHRGRERRGDHGAADGGAVPEGQPPAAARLRQADARTRTSRCIGEAAGRSRTSRTRGTGCGTPSRSSGQGPFAVEAELLYQPIGFRWADNLRKYDARSRGGSPGTTMRWAPRPPVRIAGATQVLR